MEKIYFDTEEEMLKYAFDIMKADSIETDCYNWGFSSNQHLGLSENYRPIYKGTDEYNNPVCIGHVNYREELSDGEIHWTYWID